MNEFKCLGKDVIIMFLLLPVYHRGSILLIPSFQTSLIPEVTSGASTITFILLLLISSEDGNVHGCFSKNNFLLLLHRRNILASSDTNN